MATIDVKISQMPSAPSLSGNELIPIVQDGTNKSTTVSKVIEGLATEQWVTDKLSSTGGGSTGGGSILVVTELPSKGNPNTIYLIPNESSKANDVYDEYIWVVTTENSGWEFLGNKHVEVDLTDYYNKTQVDQAIEDSEARSAASIALKVDKVEGKQLSTEDYTTAEKTKLQGIADNANNYIHPTTAGNNHIPAGGTIGQILVNDGDGIVKWQDNINYTGLEDIYSYGVEWDSTVADPKLTRIGNPLLHKSLPVQSQYKGCVANGSEINYYLDPNDWSKKVDGSDSILDGTDGTVRVHIPKFYGKSGVKGTKRWVKISTVKMDDTWIEIPEMLVDAYRSTVNQAGNKAVSVVNTTAQFRGGGNRTANDIYLDTDAFRSDLGKPRTNLSRATMRAYATNAGSEMLCYEYYKWIFYWAWVIEYATFNSQAAYNADLTSEGYHQGGLGPGVTEVDGIKWSIYNGYYPLTPCGFCNDIGNFTGVKEQPVSADITTNLTTSLSSYSKDTAGGTATNSGTSVIISKVSKANNRILYCGWTVQSGSTVYNISGLNSGQSIIFYTSGTTIATATEDGEITVDWGTSQSERQIRASVVESECSITMSIVSASQETLTMSLGTLKVPRWRGFDNPFGDIWTNLDGIILERTAANQPSNVYTTSDSSVFGDDNTAKGKMTVAGIEVAADGYIKDFDLRETGEIIPSVVGGGATTYMCDYHYCNAPNTALRTLLVGGSAYNGGGAGLGSFGSPAGVGLASASVGFRTLNKII